MFDCCACREFVLLFHMSASEKIEQLERVMAGDGRKLGLLLKDCANGFYQQMYFLGKDVIHPRGNQLQAYGFVKSPSKGLKGTSCYTYEADLRTIELLWFMRWVIHR